MACSVPFPNRSSRIWTEFDIHCFILPPGALFMEGEESRGLFILGAGTIKLTATARGGKTVTPGFEAPGEAVGLGVVVANTPHKSTAQAMERSEIGVIPVRISGSSSALMPKRHFASPNTSASNCTA
jgi:CRP-like cAMP-binding protein